MGVVWVVVVFSGGGMLAMVGFCSRAGFMWWFWVWVRDLVVFGLGLDSGLGLGGVGFCGVVVGFTSSGVGVVTNLGVGVATNLVMGWV